MLRKRLVIEQLTRKVVRPSAHDVIQRLFLHVDERRYLVRGNRNLKTRTIVQFREGMSGRQLLVAEVDRLRLLLKLLHKRPFVLEILVYAELQPGNLVFAVSLRPRDLRARVCRPPLPSPSSWNSLFGVSE